MFDDTLLDDPDALLAADTELRRIAESGARVRRETDAAAEQLTMLDNTSRPRAIVAAGSGGRLLRAVLEPSCPVPFVAWSGPGLPGWAGPLDLVVIAAPGEGERGTRDATTEAGRHGCTG
ncbi:MAG: SIS domain-containing protein, partial [Nocardioidaceae bacterium]